MINHNSNRKNKTINSVHNNIRSSNSCNSERSMNILNQDKNIDWRINQNESLKSYYSTKYAPLIHPINL